MCEACRTLKGLDLVVVIELLHLLSLGTYDLRITNI